MGKLELNVFNTAKGENGALLYRVCCRNVIVFQYKALSDACLRDKIYFKPNLRTIDKRRNKTILLKKPDIFARNSIMTMLDKGIYTFIDPNNMSRAEMILFLNFNPDIKIAHWSFDADEYIVYDDCRRVVRDNNKQLFENWDLEDDVHNGIRIRDDGDWQSGWYVKESI